MPHDRSPRPPVVALALCLAALGGGAACAKVSNSSPGTGPGNGNDAGGFDVPGGRQDAPGAIFMDAPAQIEGGSCPTPVSCTPPNGQYCGTIGDGCSGVLDCGVCPGTKICESSVCVSAADCTPMACQTATGKYCGKIGDGCGRAMDCGACDAGQVCSSSGLCVSATCVPSTCNVGTSRYCGAVGDGCGGRIDCGGCTAPATCGGGGIANVCGDPNCRKITCLPAGGGQYCGTIGDGCGGSLNCSDPCPGGMACGTGPLAGLCPGSTSTVCTGLACMVPTCAGTATTSLSGTVYDPAGKIPLYNAFVYVPNTPLDAIPEGVSCDKCSAQLSGRPIATAISDAAGHFVLSGVPAGTGIPSGSGIPLVIQVGKWRRQVTIPSVTACVDNPITDVNLTRLPRTQSEGHMPKIALTTGGSDALECFLRKTGIADTEFTTSAGTGRINLFTGGEPVVGGAGQGSATFSPALGGATFPYAMTLWSNPTQLLTYDILMMSCEGGQYPDAKVAYTANIKRYADAGGRLFNDHLHFYWLRNGPAPWPGTASYIGNGPVPVSPINGTVNTTFPKGMALASWLVNVGASTVNGQIQIYGAQYSVAAVTPPTQAWITLNQSPPAVEYLSFNTPVEAAPEAQCGRVVETDLHVKAVVSTQNGKDNSDPTKPFPTTCLSTVMSAQEKALEFLFFDLSACVLPPGATPTPPPPGLSSTPPPVTPTPPPIPPPPPPPPPPPIP